MSTGVRLNQASFAFSILFIFVAFIQLVITAVYGLSSKHRSRFEKPVEFLRHRLSFTILMMMTLLMLIISFAFKAATFSDSFDFFVRFWYDLSQLVREMSTELLFAGLLMFLKYCEYAESDFAGTLKSTFRRIIMFPLVLVFIMAACTMARLVLFIVNQVSGNGNAWILLASFITFQVYTLAYLIFTIFFVVTAARAWQCRRSLPSFDPLDL